MKQKTKTKRDIKMNEETKKRILKFELYDDGTSVTEQDLLGLLGYLQKIATEGGKTVDVITDVIVKTVTAIEEKFANGEIASQKHRKTVRDCKDEWEITGLNKENAELRDKLDDVNSELCQAKRKIKDLEDEYITKV